MIKISIDEALAYDMLSILSVKAQEHPTVRPGFERLLDEIVSQIERSIHEGVMQTQYPILWATNSAIFHRINDLKTKGEQPGDATDIDSLNYTRWQIKKALQEQFFPEPLSEQKVGYR